MRGLIPLFGTGIDPVSGHTHPREGTGSGKGEGLGNGRSGSRWNMRAIGDGSGADVTLDVPSLYDQNLFHGEGQANGGGRGDGTGRDFEI